MKNRPVIMTGLVAALVGFTAGAQATPIVGSVAFGGGDDQVGGIQGDLTTATSFAIRNAFIVDQSGVFTFASNPHVGPTVYATATNNIGLSLWSVDVGSVTYKLTVDTASVTHSSAVQFDLAGTGTLTDGNPSNDTSGVWEMGFGVSGSSFSWHASNASVPDGAATAILLGSSLTAMGLIHRGRKQSLSA